MLLIADSGSTKTDWKLVDETDELSFQTMGINPFYMKDEEIENELINVVVPKIKKNPDQVFFYGAGIISEQKQRMEKILSKGFQNATVEAESDLLAAARALCGKQKGIACIMGTGANSCLYDGEKIIDNIPPLGFIQGDEGSGAVLGKKLVTMYLKRELPQYIADAFLKEYGLNVSDILQKVYKEAFPNRFLASFTRFINKHISNELVYRMVYDSFNEFLIRNVFKYPGYQKLDINFIGSVAFYFKDILLKVAKEHELKIGNIISSPIDNLVKFHLNLK
ncbi:MAG: ATPase [Bacteroidota bacterium]